MTAQLFVRYPDGSLAGILQEFTEFTAIQRFNLPGSWSLKCPDSKMARTLKQPGHGLVAIRGKAAAKKTLISGPFRELDHAWSKSGQEFVISGLSDDIALWDRTIWPGMPTELSGPTAFPQSYDDRRSGDGESVLYAYVQEHLLNPVRQVPGAQQVQLAENLHRGLQIVETPRFDVLGERLASAAIHAGGLGFSIRAEFVNETVAPQIFRVYEPVDRRLEAVFSRQTGNLESFQHKLTAPTATIAIVLGKGEGQERSCVIVRDDAAAVKWGRHIETTVDQRQTEDLEELRQKGEEILADRAEKSELSFRPRDVKHRTWGVDYDLGDLADAEGVLGQLTEVSYTLDGNGETIDPSLTTTTQITARMLSRLFDEFRSHRKRIDYLERSV